MNELMNLTHEVEAELLKLKNYLHTIPEIGGEEYLTSKFVENEMEKLNLPIHYITETCFYAVLDTGKPGKSLVMRADMDGLPMDEEPVNKAGIKKEVISGIPRMCHACGHDAHMAILIAGAKVLTKYKENLKGGKIYFLFEAGEENAFSTKDIVKWLVSFKPDGMFALHMSSVHETGKISVNAGPRTSGISSFDFTVKGRGGHSSRPDESINPIIAASNAVITLQSAIMLHTNPLSPSTLAVTGISSGSSHNIIPDYATFYGSYRFTDLETGEIINNKIEEIVENAVRNYGCTVEINPNLDTYMPTINDEFVSEIASNALRKVHPEMEAEFPVMLGSESMGWYFKEVPGCFAWIGVGSSELGTDAAHHNGFFDLDNSMLKPALDLSVQFAVDFLES